MAEYTGNDHNSKTTVLSLFFANYGYNSQFQANTRPTINLSNTRARALTITIQDIQDMLEEMMKRAQEIYLETADQR